MGADVLEGLLAGLQLAVELQILDLPQDGLEARPGNEAHRDQVGAAEQPGRPEFLMAQAAQGRQG